MKKFGGQVLFLNRRDINTDDIIPAKYLTEISKEALKSHLFEDLDLNLEGFDSATDKLSAPGVGVIVTRANFGCGSSREHAAWVLEVNGITAVIAPGFARIFRQNMFNCGMLAIAVDDSVIDRLFEHDQQATVINFDFQSGCFTVRSKSKGEETFNFKLSEFDKTLVEAEGWVGFAASRY